MLRPSRATGPAIRHGVQYEPIAVDWYEKKHDFKIADAGLFVYKEMPFLAASPDGIVNEDTLLEVKCPFAAKNQYITIESVPYLTLVEGALSLKKDHIYYYQIQGQLLCAGRKMCHLVIFTLKDAKLIFVKRDDTFIENMKDKLKAFYESYFRKMYIEKVFHKNYDKFDFKY